jgi:hypothetical protein
MARASKTTTSTTINKYHFLFYFLYWSLIQIKSRIASSCLVFSILAQHMQYLSRFLHSVRQEGRLSVARSVCDLVVDSGWGAVRLWDCGGGVQRPRPTLPKREPSPAEPCSCPGPARPNPAKPSGFVVSAVACAGIEIYNLVNVTELYNGVKKKKGYIINYPGFY